ncbi:MAG: SDR family oxidoreductase [Planctomycetes bacterium]|nr:SDR family oxidoreductase [Planctomycetota bacterium]
MASLSFDLSGKVVLVTGGTSGIGLAIAEAMLDAGAKVAVGSRKPEKVTGALEQLSKGRPQGVVLSTQLDVADRHSIDAAIGSTLNAFGRVDVLVNCAGSNLKKPTIDVEEAEHKWLFDVNYFGPFYASQAFARQCIKQGKPDEAAGGYSIINVCSVTSFLALSEVTTYACTKGALLALTRQLAVEWPRLYGIRVNGIAPGFVPADQNRQILQSGDRGRRILECTPMQRFGTPDEIAGAVVYLASPAGRFVNGECINIDGGFMIHGVSDAMKPLT